MPVFLYVSDTRTPASCLTTSNREIFSDVTVIVISPTTNQQNVCFLISVRNAAIQSGDMLGDLRQGSLCHEEFNHGSDVIQDGDHIFEQFNTASHDVTLYGDSTEDSVAHVACK